MTNKSESIVPVFKANVTEKNLEGVKVLKGVNYKICHTKGNRWQGCDNWSLNFVDIDINTLQISLDNGKEWHSLERVSKLIELGLQYEYAIEQLSPPEENHEQRN